MRWVAIAAVLAVVSFIAAGLLQPTGRVEGRVLREGVPVADAEVTVIVRATVEESPFMLPWIKPHSYRTRTDDDGAFAFSRIRTDCALEIGVTPLGERGPVIWQSLEVADGVITDVDVVMPVRGQ